MTLINCGSVGSFRAVLLEQESVVKFLCEKIRLLTGPQCIFLRDLFVTRTPLQSLTEKNLFTHTQKRRRSIEVTLAFFHIFIN